MVRGRVKQTKIPDQGRNKIPRKNEEVVLRLNKAPQDEPKMPKNSLSWKKRTWAQPKQRRASEKYFHEKGKKRKIQYPTLVHGTGQREKGPPSWGAKKGYRKEDEENQRKNKEEGRPLLVAKGGKLGWGKLVSFRLQQKKLNG